MNYFPIKMSEYSIEVKSRYVTPFSIVLALMSLFNAYIYLLIYKSTTLGLICFLCSIVATSLPFLKNKCKHHIAVANLIIILFLIGITFLAVFSGGILSNAIWWLGAAPLVATFLLNAFFGIVWFVVVMADFFLIFYLGQSGQLPMNILADAAPEGRMIVSFTLNSTLIAFLCILADLIRDRAFLEKEELRMKTFQLNQTASLSKMAAAVAHEINNPLTVIRGIQMRILRMIGSKEEVDKKLLSEFMEKVQRNILRIQDVTGLMRTISEKARDRTISSINLKQMLLDIIQMRTEELQSYNINYETHLPEEAVVLSGNFSELFQAVLNVVDNAIFELKNSPMQPKTLKVILFRTKSEIRVLIEDNGEGIPKELRGRVFDPFYRFSNYDDIKGLSLSFSQSVLNSSGGALELLDSAKGTVFQMCLPLHKKN